MLKVVCAWHSVYFPQESTLLLDEFPDEPNGTSHGICKPCNSHFMRENGLEVTKGPTRSAQRV